MINNETGSFDKATIESVVTASGRPQTEVTEKMNNDLANMGGNKNAEAVLVSTTKEVMQEVANGKLTTEEAETARKKLFAKRVEESNAQPEGSAGSVAEIVKAAISGAQGK